MELRRKFMKKTKSYSVKPVLSRAAFFLLICLPLFLCFGCVDDEPEEDMSISEITITNIPTSIPVKDKETTNSTFKIYLNASNSQSPTDPPVAKGVAKFGTLSGDKCSITIKLQNPNSGSDKNPNTNTGSWSGTATYFSVMISPQSVATDEINAVWMKAGMTLNKGKKECNWNSLMDSRSPGSLVDQTQVQALYAGIIIQDPDITKE